MAVVRVNEEFALIREEERKRSDAMSEMTKEMTKEIKNLMQKNPSISAKEIAECLDETVESVRYRIKLMKKAGEITRQGSTKAGKWRVLR